MKNIVVPRNTRGSNMDEPLWCDPNAKRNPNNTPEENARIDALLKELDEIYPEKSKDKTGSDSR